MFYDSLTLTGLAIVMAILGALVLMCRFAPKTRTCGDLFSWESHNARARRPKAKPLVR